MDNSIISFLHKEMNSYSGNIKSEIDKLLDENVPFVLYSDSTKKISGIMNLITTVSIAHDFKGMSFSERYCFRDTERAYTEFLAWYKRGFDEQRPTGWIACRSVSGQDIKNSMEKYHSKDYASEALSAYLRLKEKISSFIPYEMIIREMDMEDENEALHQIAYLRVTGSIE